MVAIISPLKEFFPAILRSPINAGAFCMVMGLIIVPVVSLVSKPPEKEKVDEIFSCYDKTVTVTVKTAIDD